MKTKKWSNPKGKKSSSKFTRQNYIEIGNTLKKLPEKKRITEYIKYNKIFKADNPLYDSKRFKKYIKL